MILCFDGLAVNEVDFVIGIKDWGFKLCGSPFLLHPFLSNFLHLFQFVRTIGDNTAWLQAIAPFFI